MVEGTECITPIFNHPSRSEESTSTANPPGSVQDSTTSTIKYTLFKFDVKVERELFDLPLDFANSLPPYRVVKYSCLDPYLTGKKAFILIQGNVWPFIVLTMTKRHVLAVEGIPTN